MIEMTDGGLETVLIFEEGLDLPAFAAFPLLESEQGRAALRRYYEGFLTLARERGVRFVFGTPTWRANPDWGRELGYSTEALAETNRRAVAFARELGADVVDGVLGPRGDGYVVTDRMSAEEAERYHAWQIGVLRDAGVDRITALTLSYPEEAIGVVRAAEGMVVVPSFTVETDGRLPDGTPLAEAIAQVDAATNGAAAFFGVNCAHPTHVAAGVHEPVERVGLFRTNGSALSHAELDAMEELDSDDPQLLARDHGLVRELFPQVQTLGGCCGTDHRHVAAVVAAWG